MSPLSGGQSKTVVIGFSFFGSTASSVWSFQTTPNTWRGPSGTTAVYEDVVTDVRNDLKSRVAEMAVWGIDPERVVLDPGLGFAKRPDHNWQLLRDLEPLMALGHPVLVGASRKSFLGRLLADRTGTARPVDQREHANTALTVLLAQRGVWGLRVHDVRAARDALDVLQRLDGPPPEGVRR